MKSSGVSLPVWVGLRYLAAKRRNHFISFISASSMIGMTLGVAVLILVLSVMNGFDRELRERILGMVPHGKVRRRRTTAQQQQRWQGGRGASRRHPHSPAATPTLRCQ